jgi:hypothetical protein
MRLTKVAQFDDGTTEYSGVDANGDITLIIRPDGTGLEERIVGFCGRCFKARLEGERSCGFPGHPPSQSGFGVGVPAPVHADVAVSDPPLRGVPPEHAGSDRVVSEPPAAEPVPERRRFRGRKQAGPDAPVAKTDAEPVAPVIELKPTVSPEVDGAAQGLAVAVRSRLVMGRAELYQGRPAADVDRYLAHAIAQEWVVADGDQIRPGRVDPRPLEPVGDVDGPSWGPAGGSFRRFLRGFG